MTIKSTVNIIWTQPGCAPCNAAKQLLTEHGYVFDTKVIGSEYSKEDFFKEVPGARSVPQIILGGNLIGNLDQLKEYLKHANS